MIRFFFPILSLSLVLIGCSPNGGDSLDVQKVFSSQTTVIQYEVDYMKGAEPFVGETNSGDEIWNFLKNNVTALFQSTKSVTVPTTLPQMAEIPAGGKNYTKSELLELAEIHRNNPPLKDGTATIYILYVDGYFVESAKTKEDVLGVSFGDTGVIAMFKPAILASSFSSELLGKFIEQSVLIHESGHSLGLVNNGLDLTSAHQDPEHGAHCTNELCTMYYLNEGVKDLIEFLARKGAQSTETIIFGQECIDDAVAAIH